MFSRGSPAIIGLTSLWRTSARMLATTSKSTRIGIVGCGNVGTAVANNLLRNGFQLIAACDTDPGRLTSFPETVKRCATPKEVAEASEVVVTGLPRPPNVQAAAEGPDGILAGLSKDKVWVDHSTTDYEQTQEYDKLAQEKGAYVLEAPITGGLGALKKGNMAVHLGGDKKVADAMTPMLKASYREIFYVGPIGTAMIVKVTSNMLCCVSVVAMTEVLLLAKRAGIDLKTFWDATRLGAGNSFAWEVAGPLIFKKVSEPDFKIDLQTKDLQLGYDMARKFRVPMALNQLTFSIYRLAQYQLGDKVGWYAPAETFEDALKESLRDTRFKNWDYDIKFIDGSLVVTHANIE